MKQLNFSEYNSNNEKNKTKVNWNKKTKEVTSNRVYVFRLFASFAEI